MIFTLVDVILIAIVLIFAIAGFILGLIHALGSLIGLGLGVWVASHYFMPFADWLTPILLGHSGAAKVVAFILLFVIINRLVGLVFYLLEKAFHLLSIIPFLGSINKISGLLLGLVEGVLITGLVIYIIAKFTPDLALVTDNLNGSKIAHLLVLSTQTLTFLMPQALEKIQSIF